MRCFKMAIALGLIFLSFIGAKAQNQSVYEGNFMINKIVNGMNITILPINNMPNTEVVLYIKTGSVHDTDSLLGGSTMLRLVHQHKIERALASGTLRLNKANTTFKSYSTGEQIVFSLTSAESNLSFCMALLRDSVLLSSFRLQELDSARNEMYNTIDSAENNIDEVFKAKLLHSIYKQDYYRVTNTGKAQMLKNFNLSVAKQYKQKYYTPNNSIISITGRVNGPYAREVFENTFSKIEKSDFDPEIITKIIDFHPVIYNTQFVVNKAIDNPCFEICWQFPGTTNNHQASVFAYLLTSIINDKNNYLQVKAAKLGCKEFTATYNAKSFSGMLCIKLVPDKNKLYETYSMVMEGLLNLHTNMMNESMVMAGKLLFKKQYNEQLSKNTYSQDVIKHWPFNDEYYYLALKDTVQNVTVRQMQKFCYEYMHQSSYAAGLMISEEDRTALNIDSVFTDLNEDIKDYVFTYRPNITDLEGNDNLKKQDKLVQWLKINPDLYVKVNGFADEGEFNKTYDDSIRLFIDSSETFRRTMPQLLKTKWLRPEMMRALKVIKYLADHGIAQERLAGTSIRFKSEDEAAALNNMKVTVSQEKLRKLNTGYIPIDK